MKPLLLTMFATHLIHGQPSQGYQGAHAVLEKMSKAPYGSVLNDPKVLFAKDMVMFESNMAGMPPAEAAKGWLGLARKSLAIAESNHDFSQGWLIDILPALPSPESWPFIASDLDDPALSPAQRLGLELLMDVLQGKNERAWADLDTIEKLTSDEINAFELVDLKVALAVHSRDADRLISALTHESDKMTDEPRTFSNMGGPDMQIPDLVPLLGTERARALLTHILLTAKAELRFDGEMWGLGEPETKALALQIAKENKARLAYPQWTLAASADAGDLFDLFRKRFPRIKMGITWSNPPSGSTFDYAAKYRFVSLFLSGNRKAAERFVESYGDSLGLDVPLGMTADDNVLTGIQSAGKMPSFLSFLGEMAARHPSGRLADFYLDAMREYAPLSRQEEALKRFESWKAMPDYVQNGYRGRLVDVYLRDGKLTEAAALMSAAGSSLDDPFESAPERLALLGQALAWPDILKRGLDAIVGQAADSPFGAQNEIDFLLLNGRGPELERALIKRLVAATHDHVWSSPPSSQSAALSLVEFYDRLGRSADVVALLERFPKWDAPDIAYLANQGRSDRSPLLIAATALAKLGRTEEALRILRVEIQRCPSNDDAYAVLLDCGGAETDSILDGLAREFPLDPRPHIWKAKLLLKQGRRAQADGEARRAIDLDPNDLETWDGTRTFLAYQVLAEVERRRDPTYARAAKIFRIARTYEAADMFGKAADAYRKELGLVPGDFRTRLELGVDLIQMGKRTEGERQIRIACRSVPAKWGNFEALPNLGYVLRPGFAAAEAALQSQVKQGSRNPGVYAFLGMIEAQSHRTSEAIARYRRAISLDRDCFAAWTGLESLMPAIPSDFQPQVIANYVRLNPSQEDFPFQAFIPDYRACWLESAKAFTRRIQSTSMLFELRASCAALERGACDEFVQNGRWPVRFTPHGALIAADPVISSIGNLLTKPMNVNGF